MRDAYKEALDTLIDLGAERALILHGPAPLKAHMTHGFDSSLQWSDQVSLSILERSMEGEPLLLGDVASTTFGERMSVQMTGIRSVVCVPFWSPSSRILGLIYVDTRSMQAAFTRNTMNAVLSCARRLERTLYGGAVVQAAPRPAAVSPIVPTQGSVQEGAKLGLRRQVQRPVAPQIATPIQIQPSNINARPNQRSLVVFLRSLATLINAGINIHRALLILGQHESDRALRQACQYLASRVASGSNLSSSMAQCPQIFQRFDFSIIQVGEQSGALDRVLVELAELRERQLDHYMQLKSALAYPCILSLLCLAALILAPPFVLRGQLDLMRQLGQQPPLITRILILMSDAMMSPWAWLLSAIVLVAALWSLSRYPQVREKMQDKFLQLPILRRLLLHAGCGRFAHGLALTYKVGIPIDQCLTLATRLSGLKRLEEELPMILSALRHGSNLSDTLAHSNVLPPSFAALTRAGEESGKLDTLLAWISRFYEIEFETNLESLISLLQPLLILVMGVVIGVLLLATLMPMVKLVQQL